MTTLRPNSPMLWRNGVERDPTLYPAGVRAARDLLSEATHLANELACDHWEFAVEIWILFDLGLSPSDIRTLVCLGALLHRYETTAAGASGRSFSPPRAARLTKQSCFVLNEDACWPELVPDSSDGSVGCWAAARGPLLRLHSTESSASKPHWNSLRRELMLDGQVIKAFRRPAPNQQIILQVFEEEGWPERIADPLPMQPGHSPKRRLHETIQSLNDGQAAPLVVFHGDGTGEGVLWERVCKPLCRVDSSVVPLVGSIRKAS